MLETLVLDLNGIEPVLAWLVRPKGEIFRVMLWVGQAMWGDDGL